MHVVSSCNQRSQFSSRQSLLDAAAAACAAATGTFLPPHPQQHSQSPRQIGPDGILNRHHQHVAAVHRQHRLLRPGSRTTAAGMPTLAVPGDSPQGSRETSLLPYSSTGQPAAHLCSGRCWEMGLLPMICSYHWPADSLKNPLLANSGQCNALRCRVCRDVLFVPAAAPNTVHRLSVGQRGP